MGSICGAVRKQTCLLQHPTLVYLDFSSSFFQFLLHFAPAVTWNCLNIHISKSIHFPSKHQKFLKRNASGASKLMGPVVGQLSMKMDVNSLFILEDRSKM